MLCLSTEWRLINCQHHRELGFDFFVSSLVYVRLLTPVRPSGDFETGMMVTGCKWWSSVREKPGGIAVRVGGKPGKKQIIDGTGSIGAAVGPLLTGYISTQSWSAVFSMLMVAAFVAGLFLTRLVVAEIATKWQDSRRGLTSSIRRSPTVEV
ncbi:major facilitator superfamily domain protein [Artemisia annua]|uniref:Major facilitator superfamily domain protein n=1 Tax=Artemisia annua TaxID=35608 RepID=A0A2U1MQM2_ARTAN|nr:major facilitator superfamily domain protein [Artemisia annua]